MTQLSVSLLDFAWQLYTGHVRYSATEVAQHMHVEPRVLKQAFRLIKAYGRSGEYDGHQVVLAAVIAEIDRGSVAEKVKTEGQFDGMLRMSD